MAEFLISFENFLTTVNQEKGSNDCFHNQLTCALLRKKLSYEESAMILKRRRQL